MNGTWSCFQVPFIYVLGGSWADGQCALDCWDPTIKCPCSLSRVGVKPAYQSRGIAKELLRQMETDLVRRGFDGIQLLVGKINRRAVALYKAMGFQCCGETSLYDLEWYCYEKKLEPVSHFSVSST